jgi:hypothetical protein
MDGKKLSQAAFDRSVVNLNTKKYVLCAVSVREYKRCWWY